MPVALKRNEATNNANAVSSLAHLLWFCVAGLFVAALIMSYGIDLSAGFF